MMVVESSIQWRAEVGFFEETASTKIDEWLVGH